jgi:hypothetical protein
MKESNKSKNSKTTIAVIVFGCVCIFGSICMGYFFWWFGGLDEEMLIKFVEGETVVEHTDDGVRVKTWTGVGVGGGIGYSDMIKREKETSYVNAMMYHVPNQKGFVVDVKPPEKHAEYKGYSDFAFNITKDSQTYQYGEIIKIAQQAGANYIFIKSSGYMIDIETSGWGIGISSMGTSIGQFEKEVSNGN